MKLPKDAGGLTAATVARPDDNIVIVTDKGKAKYMRVSLAPQAGRNTKGDYVISMRPKEVVAQVVKLEGRIDALRPRLWRRMTRTNRVPERRNGA